MNRLTGTCALAVATALVACSQSSDSREHAAAEAEPLNGGRPAIFARGEGEHLLMVGRRPLYITVDPATTGSPTLMAGVSDIAPGDSIPVHKHLGEEEILFIHRGTVVVMLGEQTRQVGAGATVFIPRGTWIGVRTVGPDTATTFFVFNAPAYEKCLRAQSSRPGQPYTPPAAETMEAMRRECHQVRKG